MRNPFAVDDVPDPAGPEVEAFARAVPAPTPAADDADDNAVAWVAIATSDEGLEGAWASRWRAGHEDWRQGVATVRRAAGAVFILYRDHGTYLIEAEEREGGALLVGRLVNVEQPSETSPWVGHVVTPHRIDGYWARGRWDLRRSSPDERPEPIVSAVLTEARRLGPTELRELLGFARYLRWRGERP